jgi:two-component system NarL family response regulator
VTETTRQAPISVLIADDQALFREGIATLLSSVGDIVVVGKAHDGEEAVAQAQELAPDVVLMDIQMPKLSGIEATLEVRRVSPSTKVVVLTSSEDEADLYEALRAGATGYLLKVMEPEAVATAIRESYEGNSTISPSMASKLITEFNVMASGAKPQPGKLVGPQLTDREMEVLRLISAEGVTNKVLARRLNISESTIKNHISNILEKLHLSSRMEAVLYAFREGLVEEPVQH